MRHRSYSSGLSNTKIYITVNVKCKSKREAYRNSTFGEMILVAHETGKCQR